MQLKSILLLSVFSLIAVTVAFYITQYSHQRVPSEFPRLLFPDLIQRINEVVSVTIRDVDSQVVIKRKDPQTAQWIVEGKGYPANFDRVKRTVLGIANLRILEERTNDPERFSRLHLQDLQNTESKAVEIVLQDMRNTPVASLLVGKINRLGRGGELFVRKLDETQSWLVEGNLNVPTDSLEWLDRNLARIEYNRTRRITIQHPDGEQLSFGRELPEQENLTSTGLPSEGTPKTAEINSLTRIFDYFVLDDVVPRDTLDFSEATVTDIETFDGLILSVHSLEQEQKYWISLNFKTTPYTPETSPPSSVPPTTEATVQEQALWLNRRYGNWAYQVSSYMGRRLRLRGKDLVEETN